MAAMKVVYTNSRGDKCLWEVSIVWCKQINHNKLGQHSVLEITTPGRVFLSMFTFPSTSSTISLNHEWHHATPKRAKSGTVRRERNNFYSFPNSPALQLLVCFALPLHSFPSVAPKTPLFFSNWLQRLALCFFPSYIFPNQKNKTI